MIEMLFILILPLAAFLGGAYLMYRGFRRLSSATAIISGTVGCVEEMRSRMTNEKCVYSRVVVEYYKGGHQPWKEVFAFERRAPFLLGGKRVDTKHADFRISNPVVYKGYVKREKGALEKAVDYLQQPLQKVPGVEAAKEAIDITREAGDFGGEVRRGEFLEQDVFTSVIALSGAKERIMPHIRKPLRVSEYMIKEGAALTVVPDPAVTAGSGPAMAGTLEFPLIISDARDAAGSSMREKAYLSLFLGVLLLCVSVFLLLFLMGWL